MTRKNILVAGAGLALITGCGGTGSNNSAVAGNGSASNGSAGANMAAPAPGPSAGGAVDRNFVVGHWGRAGDCSETLSFNADGSATGGPVEAGSRWSLEGDVLTVTETDGKPEPARVGREGDNLAVIGPGGDRMTLTRCAAAGTGSPAQRPTGQ